MMATLSKEKKKNQILSENQANMALHWRLEASGAAAMVEGNSTRSSRYLCYVQLKYLVGLLI